MYYATRSLLIHISAFLASSLRHETMRNHWPCTLPTVTDHMACTSFFVPMHMNMHLTTVCMRLATGVYGIGITVHMCTIFHLSFFSVHYIYMLIRMSPFTVWTICFLQEVCMCAHEVCACQIETIYLLACAYLYVQDKEGMDWCLTVLLRVSRLEGRL